MHELQRIFTTTLVQGLKRKSLDKCSIWAERYRVMGKPFPGPWTHLYHPWTREMQDSEAPVNVGQKSAQAGYTEVALNRMFFHIDIRGVDCLYVLPNKMPDASDFSASRFDGALELSDHLAKLFGDVKNVGHKRAGSVNLYIRGSNSRGALKSIPVGFIVFDEVDEMNQDNIVLAEERTSGQVYSQIWKISTPTVPLYGINRLFIQSTQEEFFFKCPHCDKRINLIWPRNIVITADDRFDPKIKNSHLICHECKCKLEHEDKKFFLANGIWVPQTENQTEIRGFRVNQMYSSAKAGRPENLAIAYLEAQVDKAAEQEFYNSKLGLPHIVDGAKITSEDVQRTIKDFSRDDPYPVTEFRTMGVDVGKWLHVEVDSWSVDNFGPDINIRSRCRLLKDVKVMSFEELDDLMRQYQIMQCVIDANPERRKAYEFACRFYGFVKMCFYGRGVNGKMINVANDNSELPNHSITVDRTSWLDMSLGRFHNHSIILPRDVTNEYKSHIQVPVRIYEKDPDGNMVGKYISSTDDHYAHARNYSEIALPLAAAMSTGQNIRAFL